MRALDLCHAHAQPQPKEKTFEVARHLMSADLRRTCHYSITLEGTTARLWRYCRTWALYSEPFDINKVRGQWSRCERRTDHK